MPDASTKSIFFSSGVNAGYGAYGGNVEAQVAMPIFTQPLVLSPEVSLGVDAKKLISPYATAGLEAGLVSPLVLLPTPIIPFAGLQIGAIDTDAIHALVKFSLGAEVRFPKMQGFSLRAAYTPQISTDTTQSGSGFQLGARLTF